MGRGEHYGDEGLWSNTWREMRHNPCMMSPLSALMIIFIGLVMFVTLLLQAPVFLLGFLTTPILTRSAWFIEFLYPWNIAGWAHFFLIKKTSKSRHRDDDKNRGFHCRAVEQKIEVIKDRVYIHPIPQHLDNVGYLVLCLPGRRNDRRKSENGDAGDPIVALMVDCGDAEETNRAIELVQKYHYPNKPFQLQAICSTHKHHDHTGGNRQMLRIHSDHLNAIYGGEVERVPYCTHPVVNGDLLEMPKSGGNDMGRYVEIEVAAVPAHTRGSVVYILRTKQQSNANTYVQAQSTVEYMFTGDTMFSGGGGVPFESDLGSDSDSKLSKSNGNTMFRASLGPYAIERCFAELLVRALPNAGPGEDVGERIMVLPGHEYSAELLTRQFHANMMDSCKWKNFPPREFFETVSQMYVALHRQSLPHNSGKLLAIPTPLRKELCISPHFRSMKRNAELVVRAVVFWHSNFCKDPLTDAERKRFRKMKTNQRASMDDEDDEYEKEGKTPSKARRWVVDSNDISRDVFTTVYSADLEDVIKGLASGGMRRGDAAQRLLELQAKLATPVINRRPIPGYLPSDKNIFKGVAALALLGALPCAMTLSDSRVMKLQPPIDSNSDRIKISKQRLILILDRLGAFETEDEGPEVIAMIDRLWNESRFYAFGGDGKSTDLEAPHVDELELGVLKWMIYGIPSNQPSWFSCFCMPCSGGPPRRSYPEHPAKEMQKRAGDLVAHDVLTCYLCRNATGCPDAPGKSKASK